MTLKRSLLLPLERVPRAGLPLLGTLSAAVAGAAAERRRACRSAGRSSSPSTRASRSPSESLKGKPFAVFFGFTHCPEVCPTTLYDLTQDLEALGADADKLQVAFITVDPARDTPELMKTYLSSFDPRIVGLTGTEEEIAAARPRLQDLFPQGADRGSGLHHGPFRRPSS